MELESCSSDNDDIFITQSTFRKETYELARIPYCPCISDISVDEVDESEEYEVAREVHILDAAETLQIPFEDVENALKTAIDIQDMPALGGASIISVWRPALNHLPGTVCNYKPTAELTYINIRI